jgi:hypothetical protein
MSTKACEAPSTGSKIISIPASSSVSLRISDCWTVTYDQPSPRGGRCEDRVPMRSTTGQTNITTSKVLRPAWIAAVTRFRHGMEGSCRAVRRISLVMESAWECDQELSMFVWKRVPRTVLHHAKGRHFDLRQSNIWSSFSRGPRLDSNPNSTTFHIVRAV